ncbi:uncharacterized protein LOC126799616 [Argentina anserina]|uniref:uncharacterized protein LOC126799616 n=1 Tax=Argentina anserina TaxID=57926 RepID=UPI0021765008|nr:uncharacterized protein LOC126799616 [Potentilla anserina]
MENYRSKSCRDERNMQMEVYYGGSRDERNMQMEVYYGGKAAAPPAPPAPPTSMRDLKSYSVNYGRSGSSFDAYPNHQIVKDAKTKKGKSSLGTSTSKIWSLADPELRRKKRVAGYKVYSAEEKMKGSFKKSFKWIKSTYTQVVYGWR